MAPRIRRSLAVLEKEWIDSGKPLAETELGLLIKAFQGIQALPPNPDSEAYPDNSFFALGGYHGEPFRGKGITNPNWWGGYCNHGNVLFPTWHRAYLLRVEDALRSVPGCGSVTLPFWDECLYLPDKPKLFDASGEPTGPLLPEPEKPIDYIPTILTTPKLPTGEANPLYSYALKKAIDYQIEGGNQRYSKPEDYNTVRYPLSGLVGNEKDKKETKAHNLRFQSESERTDILNANVQAWLIGTIKDKLTGDPQYWPSDLTSVYGRFLNCLKAPNYTLFSNTRSQGAWNADPLHSRELVTSLESPHNSIHLAVGGFYQEGDYNASPIIGANGDMGCNETAGFDPIFYLHHCFIDYTFWQWQKRRGLTEKGSLQIDYSIGAGTRVVAKDAGYPLAENETGQKLTMDTPLHPFRKPEDPDVFYTSNDVTDIADLGYEYGLGSLDVLLEDKPETRPWIPLIGEKLEGPVLRLGHNHRTIVQKKVVTGINRADYTGSFVIRTFTTLPSGKEIEVGREAILSRWQVGNCENCRDKLEVEAVVGIDHVTLAWLKGDDQDRELEYRVKIQQIDKTYETQYPSKKKGDRLFAPPGGPPEPILKDIEVR